MQPIKVIKMRWTLIVILITVSLLFSQVYALTALYNALPDKLSLNYGDKRTYPIIVKDSPETRYSYTITIDGVKTDNNGFIKVSLTDKKGRPLSHEFSNENLTLSFLVLRNNDIRKVREIYLHIEYFNAVSQSKKYKVMIEILPLNEGVYDSTVTSTISYGLVYTFDVYANAYIQEINVPSITYQNSVVQDSVESINNVGSIKEVSYNSYKQSSDRILISNDVISNQSILNESYNVVVDRDGNRDGGSSKKNDLLVVNNATQEEKKSSIIPITGKAVSRTNTLTIVIIILGSTLIYLLWKII